MSLSLDDKDEPQFPEPCTACGALLFHKFDCPVAIQGTKDHPEEWVVFDPEVYRKLHGKD